MNTQKTFGATLSSRGLYSSWCHVPKYDLLFDCGEGCSMHLGNGLSNVTKIFISHDHGDHTLGLVSFIGLRNTVRGTSKNPDTYKHNKPLIIYYPKDNALMLDLIAFINKRHANWLRYTLTWVPIGPNEKIQVGHNTFVHSFGMKHQKSACTLGYVIKEERKRLRPEFVGQNIPELLAHGTITKEQLTEDYAANLFAYCLDSYELSPIAGIEECEHVVMDCTFINKEDRTDMTHFTLEEALVYCHNNGIKNMYAAHISPRYEISDIVTPFDSMVTKVHIIDPYKITTI